METTPFAAETRLPSDGGTPDTVAGRVRTREIDYASLVAAAGDCTTVTSDEGRYLYVAPTCGRLVGWTVSELEGSSADDIVHPDDVVGFRYARTGLAPREPCTHSHRLRCRDGTFLWVEETSEVVGVGDATVVVSTLRDITQRQARFAALEHRAASDPLTGVANRTVLIDRLRHGLSRLARGHGGLGVLYLDLDRFKVVNDSLGHLVGDRVLLQMAERLTHHLRPSDTLARLGGDEFVIVAEDLAGQEDAIELANRIVTAGRRAFEVSGERFECTVSVGIAFTTDRHRGADELLHEADLALYRAKDRGRDRAEVFDEELRSAAIGRLATERLIRRAISEDGVVVDYQPIVDLPSGRVRSAEALVRLRDPNTGGLLLPATFLDVAEETALLVDIDDHVLADVARHAAGWRARLFDHWFGGVAINVTARHLADASFRDAVLEQLASHGVDPRELQVEVTERVLMEASNLAMTGLRSLRAAGVQVGLDDFGTGLSSLAYLRRFPLDFVKIDRTFIAELERGEAEQAIVAAVIEYSHALGLVVTAEGVETEGQRAILIDLGCDRAQGFLFGVPAEPKAIDELVHSQALLSR